MKPLDGITVLDFTQAFSGPYCSMTLGDYGARIIKVERLDIGDQSRGWHPFAKNGASGYFALHNRNKESIVLDLTKPEAQDIIKKLVRNCDILLENFKADTLTKMGLGYEEIVKIKPDIIFASITGYGQYGPRRQLAAYDNIIAGTCGLMERTGFADSNPVRGGGSVGDTFAGLMAAFAISVAYYHKLKTGEGQRIDVAMQDCLFSAVEEAILEYTLLDKELSRNGNVAPNLIAPYDVYECADGWFAVGSASASAWPEFCEEIGMPELMHDYRFIDNESRCQNIDALTEITGGFFLNKTREELMSHFSGKKLAVAPVYCATELINHPYMISREMVTTVDDPNIGPYTAFGIPIKFEKTPGQIARPSPLLGQHTANILSEIGYSSEEIQTLSEKGIIGKR